MMKDKRRATALFPILLLALFLACTLLPQFFARVSAERKNGSVVFSFLYSDAKNRLGEQSLARHLDEIKAAGVTTVTVQELTMNVLVDRGDIVGIRYHDIRHKYDTESRILADALGKVENISYGSHVIIASDPDYAERVRRCLPLSFSPDEYADVGDVGGCTVFVIFDGNIPTYDIPLGFDEAAIAEMRARGFDVAVSLRMGSRSSVGYIDELERIIDENGVKYLWLRNDSRSKETDENADKNIDRMAELIASRGLYFVAAENATQLSNEDIIGYDKIFDAADGRVLRAFETYDQSSPDSTGYMFRRNQYLNSVIDRNSRFVSVTQLSLGVKSAEALASNTAKAAGSAIEKLSSLGYDVKECETRLDGYERYALTPNIAAAFVATLAVGAVAAVFELDGMKAFIAAVLLAVASFAVTFVMPEQLVLLYPTCTALAISCFAVSVMLYALKKLRGRLGAIALTAAVAVPVLAVLAVGGVVMCSLLSGLDYYFNNNIFRGIKISLYAPLLYAAAAYYVMFIHKKGSFPRDVRDVMSARIRMSWAAAAVIMMAVSVIYIVRSGNVSSISSAEEAMREFITEHMAARPRTKEFVAAYPCLVLLVWYAKKWRGTLLPWGLAVGAAILPASVTNTFCHVFTNAGIQFGRLANGLLLGIFTSSVVYALNIVFTRILHKYFSVEFESEN